MTKIAQLHNGTQIHFPDEMPDHEMDAAVQRHLGVGQPPNPNTMMQLMHLLVEHANNTSVGTQKLHDTQHKTQVISNAKHVETIEQASTQIADAIDKLTQAIGAVGSAVVNMVQSKTSSGA